MGFRIKGQHWRQSRCCRTRLTVKTIQISGAMREVLACQNCGRIRLTAAPGQTHSGQVAQEPA